MLYKVGEIEYCNIDEALKKLGFGVHGIYSIRLPGSGICPAAKYKKSVSGKERVLIVESINSPLQNSNYIAKIDVDRETEISLKIELALSELDNPEMSYNFSRYLEIFLRN